MFIPFLQDCVFECNEKYLMSVITDDECLFGTSFVKRMNMCY